MTWFASHPLAVVLVPLAAAALLASAGRWLKPVAPWIAVLGPLTALATGAGALMAGQAAATAGSLPWISVGDVVLRVGFRVDSLAAIMLVVLGVVASCVVVFSAGYMHGERG